MSIIPSLLELRQMHGYSREKIADVVGVTTKTIENWENGDIDPLNISFRKTLKLATFFNISLTYLREIFEVRSSAHWKDPSEFDEQVETEEQGRDVSTPNV